MSEIKRIEECYEKRKQISSELYSYFNPGSLLIIHERERKLLELLDKYGMNHLFEKRILDVGCGSGAWLREFIKYGSDPNKLVGVELLEYRVAEARTLSPNLNIIKGNAESLDFESESFDILFQSTVFTSILDINMKQNVASEMLRVLRNDGIIIWYDFRYNNPKNPDVKGIKKKEIKRLFPNCSYDFNLITLVPPITRKLAPISWFVCYLLSKIKILNTHYLVIIRKKL